MAVDPANIFPSRLDWGPTVLMHFFQAAIFALWFSYVDVPKIWKLVLIFICAGLGFFDKFNFIWLILAFVIGVCVVLSRYPEEAVDFIFETGRWRCRRYFVVGFAADAVLNFAGPSSLRGQPLALSL